MLEIDTPTALALGVSIFLYGVLFRYDFRVEVETSSCLCHGASY